MPSGKQDFQSRIHSELVDRRQLGARSSSSSKGENTTDTWEPVPFVEGVSGSASLFCERFRCADLAVGFGNVQAGASKVGMQRGNWVVKFDLSVLISRIPENQVELSNWHHNSCTILGTTAM